MRAVHGSPDCGPAAGRNSVGVFIARAKWRDQSQVILELRAHSSPGEVECRRGEPRNEKPSFFFPAAECFCLRPDGVSIAGQNLGGLIYTLQPMPPAQALFAFVQQTRGNAPKLRVVGSKDLPELPAALRLPASPNQQGVGVKITYEFNSKPVEEDSMPSITTGDSYDVPQGRTWQINWGLNSSTSFPRARRMLDKRKAVLRRGKIVPAQSRLATAARGDQCLPATGIQSPASSRLRPDCRRGATQPAGSARTTMR